MPTRLIDIGGGRPLLDVASYARRGPGRRDHLSYDEIELIERTARRTPEVMVKVLGRGGQDLKAIGRHIAYLNRGGELEIETDDGQRLSGQGVETELLEDWDLDLEKHLRKTDLQSRRSRPSPKLVHKLMFSMPAGTPRDKVLAAVKSFAREEFGLKHRYAMVLHADQPHPHVHMVMKAVSEQGVRLNIRRTTLREWRREFAHHLRDQGVAANATERAVRGETRTAKLDGIYRAAQRSDSTHTRARAESVAHELFSSNRRIDAGKSKLLETRGEVERGWRGVSKLLDRLGERHLSEQVMRFVNEMPPADTEKEFLARRLLSNTLKTPVSLGPKTR